jgi:hypothetical protein
MQIGVCSWIPRDPSKELETQIKYSGEPRDPQRTQIQKISA